MRSTQEWLKSIEGRPQLTLCLVGWLVVWLVVPALFLDCLTLEYGTDRLYGKRRQHNSVLRCVKSQESADLFVHGGGILKSRKADVPELFSL